MAERDLLQDNGPNIPTPKEREEIITAFQELAEMNRHWSIPGQGWGNNEAAKCQAVLLKGWGGG